MDSSGSYFFNGFWFSWIRQLDSSIARTYLCNGSRISGSHGFVCQLPVLRELEDVGVAVLQGHGRVDRAVATERIVIVVVRVGVLREIFNIFKVKLPHPFFGCVYPICCLYWKILSSLLCLGINQGKLFQNALICDKRIHKWGTRQQAFTMKF